MFRDGWIDGRYTKMGDLKSRMRLCNINHRMVASAIVGAEEILVTCINDWLNNHAKVLIDFIFLFSWPVMLQMSQTSLLLV